MLKKILARTILVLMPIVLLEVIAFTTSSVDGKVLQAHLFVWGTVAAVSLLSAELIWGIDNT